MRLKGTNLIWRDQYALSHWECQETQGRFICGYICFILSFLLSQQQICVQRSWSDQSFGIRLCSGSIAGQLDELWSHPNHDVNFRSTDLRENPASGFHAALSSLLVNSV